MIRQKYFYHASPECGLKEIKPHMKTLPKDFTEGSVVFATDNFPFATMFLTPHDDSWANGGTFNNIPYFVISDRERFMESDKGGCIYLVGSESFKRLNNYEWFSKKRLKIRGKVNFTSGLTAMLIMGVQVFITTPKIYMQIKKAKDHGLSILNSLESENEKLGFKVDKLEMYFGSKKITDAGAIAAN
jgi:hypothetical protein